MIDEMDLDFSVGVCGENRAADDDKDLLEELKKNRERYESDFFWIFQRIIREAYKQIQSVLFRADERITHRMERIDKTIEELKINRPGKLLNMLTRGKALKKWQKLMREARAAKYHLNILKNRVGYLKKLKSGAAEIREMENRRAIRIDRNIVEYYVHGKQEQEKADGAVGGGGRPQRTRTVGREEGRGRNSLSL